MSCTGMSSTWALGGDGLRTAVTDGTGIFNTRKASNRYKTQHNKSKQDTNNASNTYEKQASNTHKNMPAAQGSLRLTPLCPPSPPLPHQRVLERLLEVPPHLGREERLLLLPAPPGLGQRLPGRVDRLLHRIERLPSPLPLVRVARHFLGEGQSRGLQASRRRLKSECVRVCACVHKNVRGCL